MMTSSTIISNLLAISCAHEIVVHVYTFLSGGNEL